MARGRRPWTILGVVLALAGAGLVAVRERRKPPLVVETVRVEAGDVRELVPSAAAGAVKPRRRVLVRAETTGTVAKLHKGRGERVTKGELVVEFDAAEHEVRVLQAEANLRAALVAKKIAATREESATRSLERFRRLDQTGAIPKAELERVETELTATRHGAEQAEATEAQARAQLRLAELQRGRAKVTAPFDGVLFELEVEVGAQATLAQPLFEVIDDSAIVFEVPVDEADIDRIHVGQEVQIHAESAREGATAGTVSYVPPAVGRTTAGLSEATGLGKRNRSVYVEVTPVGEAAFRIGASINAEFLVGQRTGVLYLPSHVVIGRGVEREVYTIDGGRARKVRFKAGLTSWERTEVTSGLERGQVVIASLGTKELKDGARVVPSDGAPVGED